MNKNIVLIQSHCNNEEKKQILLQNILKLKTFEVDILLYSHIPLEEKIISEVDYFIYDNTNPILWEERRHYYWWACDKYKLETTVPDYGWTVYNQIIGGYNFIKNKNYEYIFGFCYDVIIDENIEKFFKEPKNQIFRHIKPKDVDDRGDFRNVIFETSLIFFIFEKNIFDKIINSISLKEYSEHPEWIAEKYFEVKLQELNLYVKPTVDVYDLISESKSVFNLSKNPNYELFIDTEETLKLRFIKKSKKNISIIINDKIVNVQEDVFFFNEEIHELKIIGCFIDDVFEDWKCHLSEKKVNRITYF